MPVEGEAIAGVPERRRRRTMRTSRSGAGARAGGVLDGGWLCAREVRERMGQAAGGRTGSLSLIHI